MSYHIQLAEEYGVYTIACDVLVSHWHHAAVAAAAFVLWTACSMCQTHAEQASTVTRVLPGICCWQHMASSTTQYSFSG
jgi:hypothetical protein